MNHRSTVGKKLLATGASMTVFAFAVHAAAQVGDPCDVQAGASGAQLYIKLDILGLGTVMLDNAALEAHGCATRTTTAPDPGQWVAPPLGLVGWIEVPAGGQFLTFYETDIPVTLAGVSPGATYWVSSDDVVLDQP